VVPGHAQRPVVVDLRCFELRAALITGVAQDDSAGGRAWVLVDMQCCAGLLGDLPHRFVEPTAGIGVHLCASLLLGVIDGFRKAARCAGISLMPIWGMAPPARFVRDAIEGAGGSVEAAGYQPV
jgi:hypothetical protein